MHIFKYENMNNTRLYDKEENHVFDCVILVSKVLKSLITQSDSTNHVISLVWKLVVCISIKSNYYAITTNSSSLMVLHHMRDTISMG